VTKVGGALQKNRGKSTMLKASQNFFKGTKSTTPVQAGDTDSKSLDHPREKGHWPAVERENHRVTEVGILRTDTLQKKLKITRLRRLGIYYERGEIVSDITKISTPPPLRMTRKGGEMRQYGQFLYGAKPQNRYDEKRYKKTRMLPGKSSRGKGGVRKNSRINARGKFEGI